MDHRIACAAVLAGALVAGCSKPCDGITPSAEAKRLGVVLDGGKLCKEENEAVTIDYPDMSDVQGGYKSALEKAGWTVETPSEGVVYATKDKDTLFVVGAKKSKERGVPFAVIRYCSEDFCRKTLRELADAMKKY